MKKLILSIGTVIFIGGIPFASATTASDAEKLLNWAENTYPHFFSSHQATQNIEPWIFRHYPDTGIYVGVNKQDNNVYVLGGPWGSNPTVIDTLPNLLNLIASTGGNSSITACNTSEALTGVSYSQSGNVVTVTTNGSCVVMSDLSNTAFCKIPQQSTPSGISLLGTNTVTSSSIGGIDVSIPGMSNPFQDLLNSTANVKHCTINAPTEAVNIIVNSNLCFDITTLLTDTFGDLSSFGVTITPPVTFSSAGTYTSQTVTDCFATDASTVTDAFTSEVWIKQGSEWVKVGS